MTKLFKHAVQKASEQLADYEQDELARRLLDVIDSDERRWEEILSDPSDPRMKKLVEEALEDIRKGRTEPLDPGKL